jgi:broad specificity phosphatase PhoE
MELGLMTSRILRCFALLLAASPFAAPSLAAQATTVILVRHGEKVDESADPDLSEAGKARAEALRRTLAAAAMDRIYVTQYKRTQQTAAPTAEANHLTPVVIQARGGAPIFADSVKKAPAGSSVLIVGHSNTLGAIIEALGGPKIGDLCDKEYATLLILELQPGKTPKLIRASYGTPDAPEATACQPMR